MFLIAFPVSAAERLSLSDLMNRLEENDVALKQIIHQRTQSQFLKDLTLPSSRILFEFKNEYGISLQGAGNTSTLSGTATKDLLSSGTSLSLGYAKVNRVDREEETVQVRVEQSLLRNAFGGRNRLLDSTLDMETNLLLLEIAEAYEDYLSGVIGTYLDWQAAFVKLKVNESLYEEAQRLEKNIQRRLGKSVASSIDLDKAKLQSLSLYETVLRSRGEYASFSSRIAALGGSTSSILPQDTPPYLDRKFDFESEIQRVEKFSRSYELAKLKQKIAKNQSEYVGGMLNPDLRLVVGYNFDNSTRFATAVNRSEALVGLNLVYPLGDSQNQAEAAKANFAALQAEFQKSSTERDLKVAVTSLRVQLDEKMTEVSVSEQKLKLARSLSRRENRRYQQGRIDFETLLNSQNTLASSESEFLQKRVELSKLVVQWLNTTDQLLKSKS